MSRYRLRVTGAGACLFISLRLALEVAVALTSIDQDSSSGHLCFLGNCDHILADATRLRRLIVEWYAHGNEDVPQLGRFDETTGKPWTRSAIILTELSKKKAATEEDVSAYLRSMRLENTWGSTPEYTAFAILKGRALAVWTKIGSELRCVDSIGGALPALNLYFTNSHYEPLITEAEKQMLETHGKLDAVKV